MNCEQIPGKKNKGRYKCKKCAEMGIFRNKTDCKGNHSFQSSIRSMADTNPEAAKMFREVFGVSSTSKAAAVSNGPKAQVPPQDAGVKRSCAGNDSSSGKVAKVSTLAVASEYEAEMQVQPLYYDVEAALNGKPVQTMFGTLTLGQPIGKGVSSTVYNGQYEWSGKNIEVAVKVSITMNADGTRRALLNDINGALRATHCMPDKVVPFYDRTRDKGLVVMQLCKDGTVADALTQGTFTKTNFVDLVNDLVEFLLAAEKHGFVHGDLKPANIAMHGGKNILIDFGLSQEMGVIKNPITYPYQAAEDQVGGRPSGVDIDRCSTLLLLFEALVKMSAPHDVQKNFWGLVYSVHKTPEGHGVAKIKKAVCHRILSSLKLEKTWHEFGTKLVDLLYDYHWGSFWKKNSELNRVVELYQWFLETIKDQESISFNAHDLAMMEEVMRESP